jgi:hypothetical protein
MNCLLNLLAVCLFDSSSVYVTAMALSPINDNHAQGQGLWCADRWCPGAVGQIEIGVSVQATRSLELHYGLRHESMLMIDNDRGQEFAFVSLTWRPFR